VKSKTFPATGPLKTAKLKNRGGGIAKRNSIRRAPGAWRFEQPEDLSGS